MTKRILILAITIALLLLASCTPQEGAGDKTHGGRETTVTTAPAAEGQTGNREQSTTETQAQETDPDETKGNGKIDLPKVDF